MAFTIGDACVACGACESCCPVGAISMGDGKFEIDPDKCIDWYTAFLLKSFTKEYFPHETMERTKL